MKQWMKRLTELHEEAEGRGTSRPAVGPKNNIIGVGVPTTLEEVEEEVSSSYIDVPSIRPARGISGSFHIITPSTQVGTNGMTAKRTGGLPYCAVAELRLLDPHAVLRKLGMRESGIIRGGD